MKLEYDFSDDLGYWVHMSAHQLECAVNAELVDEGITYRQCQILALLSLYGTLSQVELAQQMRVQPPSIVMVIDRMEREGLIERRIDPVDRRKRMISPTEKSIPLWKRIVKCFEAVRKKLEKNLTSAEIETLRGLLQRVYANFDEEPGSLKKLPRESGSSPKKSTD